MSLTPRSSRWTKREDELLRELVDAGAPVKSICETLNRSEPELRRRGYYIGLPRKWFKQSLPHKFEQRDQSGSCLTEGKLDRDLERR
ncbi:hypothetical protein NLM27_25580 [Bradyrhizobium sp. CCGB12]|uniref:hypothetical protein n=1 Tax=Bradyrhizobium sp. CCGB12 TaxID=2949632 RepID=UPI0020B1FF42|nr:hypothetical protein [Bradyrhizobium sp. CCGB12]MCP3392159.1 hypothetical protein [Bradyrhizobium sp. CCGB12]